MYRTLRLALLIVFALSAQPVATLTTGGYVKVNGTVLPTTGAPTWPLSAGDEIVTAGDVVVIAFPDGARVTPARNTRVVLRVCDRCVIRLEEGAATYNMPVASKLQLCALGHLVKPAPQTEGTVSIDSSGKVYAQVAGQGQVEAGKGDCACEPKAAWLTAKKKAALILGGGGAAAAAIAVTRPGAPSTSVPAP